MAFVFEKVPEEDWDYFNSFNIIYQGEHYCADKYTQWAADKERRIYLTWLTRGLENSNVYALIWESNVIIIETEVRPTRLLNGNEETTEIRWFIEQIYAAQKLSSKSQEILALINESAKAMYKLNIGHKNFKIISYPSVTFCL